MGGAVTTVKAITGNSIKHDGATVLWGGPTDGVNVTNAPFANVVGITHKQVVVPPTSVGLTAKPYSGGTYAFNMQAGQYLILGQSTKLSGASNTELLATSTNVQQRGVHASSGDRALGEVSWDAVTNAVTKNANAGSGVQYGYDHATPPTITRSLPGEFVVLEDGATPSQKDYPAVTA